MASRILARIAAQTGVPNLAEILTRDLSGSDLQSLLLHVFQARAQRLGDSDLVAASERPLLGPSRVDARILQRFDQLAFQVAGGFEALELSPVSALGLNLVLGGIDQNSVLTTIRNSEVLGDPTPVLALECARRRRNPSTRADAIRLCASQRVIRLQPFDIPGYSPHFRLFTLVSAGRDTGSHAFEMEHLGEHLRFYLDLCGNLATAGFSLRNPLVEVSDAAVVQDLLSAAGVAMEEVRSAIRAHKPGGSEQFLADRGVWLPQEVEDPRRELPGLDPRHRLARVKTEVFDVLAQDFPEARFQFNLARLEALGYYRGLCLRISPVAPDGKRHPVIDGGFTDWTARLLQDRKERCLASGIGTEFACTRYSAAEPT